MKKVKLLLVLSLLTVILPFNVFANTFTNNNKEYNIVKADAACTKLAYVTSATDATVLYIDSETEELWSLSSDNKCTQLTLEDIIREQDKYVYISYNADFHDDGTISIYRNKEYQFVGKELIKSTTYNSETLYYINNNGSFEEVENSVESDIDLYYEYAFFKPALYSEDGSTYYAQSKTSSFFEIVKDAKTAEIGTLYTISSHENVVFDKIKTIDEKLSKALEQNTPQYIEVIATPTESAFYFLAYMDDTGSNINVYDENGALLYEGVTSFTTALDELHIVHKDSKAYFYDLNKKLLHETSSFPIVHELSQAGSASLLSFRDEDIHFITSTVVSDSTTNPNTSDDIATTLIITMIVGLSLVGLITYQTKNKSKD